MRIGVIGIGDIHGCWDTRDTAFFSRGCGGLCLDMDQ
jgi:hypothetical protein